MPIQAARSPSTRCSPRDQERMQPTAGITDAHASQLTKKRSRFSESTRLATRKKAAKNLSPSRKVSTVILGQNDHQALAPTRTKRPINIAPPAPPRLSLRRYNKQLPASSASEKPAAILAKPTSAKLSNQLPGLA